MRFRFMLRPGWLGLTAGVLIFAALSFALLAPWQFGRHADKRAQNQAIESSLHGAPVPVEDVLPGGSAPGPEEEWRRVVLTGTYLPEHEGVARLRTVHGEPAYEVLTPFRLSGGDVVLVNRGYVRPVEGTDVPDYAPAPGGEVSLTTRVRLDERDGRGRPGFEEDGHLQLYSVNATTLAASTGVDIRPGYFMLAAEQPGVLGALPLPRLNSGLNLAYGWQWLAFGAMALGGLVYYVWREAYPDRQRAGGRRSAREELTLALREDEAAPAAQLAQRYGRGR
ncbi:hypothetical protein C1701_05890 [Actinoalloteichus sp. AHMU CJ021]|uniref:SURF1 family cytochrome oxidase biogenesis protein n=2 Tax=Pseudonocardiaceae TaxID=2070 RepID=UPI0005B89CFD|nr:SURF1 family cytochrome oxidase biogenesis protein [Actinoalloteichus caeruleus]AUS77980.1 hypothetical protein C1701_05890 [Actinoalloteichus sp. AHMU CJ021]